MSISAEIKQEIRSQYLIRRKEISSKQKTRWDLLISDRLYHLSHYINANTIHLYVSIDEQNEVDTRQIIQRSLKIGKKVVVPKMSENNSLEHFEIQSEADLKPNPLGIPEPEKGREVQVSEIDLIIVPMVAGDMNRNRLGYGKGYYDRFLKNSDAIKIGLLYDLQIYPEDLPVESFDIPLDLILSESQQI